MRQVRSRGDGERIADRPYIGVVFQFKGLVPEEPSGFVAQRFSRWNGNDEVRRVLYPEPSGV
ncbi:MAG: hypothetical protein LUO88_00395 [Methanoregulaceae archaeon]|nr:hypothetical protein [Methanoregulaceae archaeon]